MGGGFLWTETAQEIINLDDLSNRYIDKWRYLSFSYCFMRSVSLDFNEVFMAL